jgi:hypothetical protein
MPVWLLGIVGTVFKPANMLVWVPVLILAGVVTYAGVSLHNYIDADKAAKAEVIQQQKDINDLKNAVVEEKQSVVIATQAMQSYEVAVQQYAAKDQVIQQQVATVRTKLNAAPIIKEVQTNAPAASADTNNNYAAMLRMFDDATVGASSASNGDGAASQTGAPAAVASHN